MRRFLVIPLLLLLAGCERPVNIPGVTSPPIVNPISGIDIYRVKNVYAATLQLAADWRTYCWSKPYRQIIADPIMKPVCKDRRATVRQIQKYQPLAGTAIRKADEFVRNNPTISAAGVIGLAWDAVTDFQRVVPRIN